MSSDMFRHPPPRPVADDPPPVPVTTDEPTERLPALSAGPRRWPLAAMAGAAVAGFVAGQVGGGARGPLLTGTLESGTLWLKPVSAAGPNDGLPAKKGGRVEVYERFVVVEDPATGVRHVRPLEQVTELSVR